MAALPQRVKSRFKPKSLKGSETLVGYLFILPAIIGFVGLVIYPLVSSVYLSMTQWTGATSPVFIGFRNFVDRFTKDISFKESLLSTGYYSPFGAGLYSVATGGAPFVDKIDDPTTVQASPEFVKAVELLREAVQKKWAPSPNISTTNELTDFAAGKIPMMEGGQWLAATLLQDHPKFKWGFAPDPSLGSGAAFYDAVGIASPSYVHNPAATWKVLAYLDTTGLGEAMAREPDAPTAYVPSASAYLAVLRKGGQTATANTVEAELRAKIKVPVAFIAPWQTQANNVVTADWNKILLGSGSGTPAGAINSMLASLRSAMKSST